MNLLVDYGLPISNLMAVHFAFDSNFKKLLKNKNIGLQDIYSTVRL